MLTTAQIRFALRMLELDHCEMLEEIARTVATQPGLSIVGDLPIADEADVDCRSSADGWQIQVAPLPSLSAGDDDAQHFVRSVARRATTLEGLTRAILTAPTKPIAAEHLADALYSHPSLVSKMTRRRRIRIDGVLTSLADLVTEALPEPAPEPESPETIAARADRYRADGRDGAHRRGRGVMGPDRVRVSRSRGSVDQRSMPLDTDPSRERSESLHALDPPLPANASASTLASCAFLNVPCGSRGQLSRYWSVSWASHALQPSTRKTRA